MTDLETMLRNAAEAEPVSFDHRDVRRRVARRRRVQMAMAGVVVVIVCGAGLVLADRGGDDTRVTSESSMVGPLTVEELTADRWVPFAYSVVTTGGNGSYVEFRDDGSFVGVFPCEIVTARWSTAGGELVFDDIEVPAECETEGKVGFIDLVRSDPVLERAGPGALQLRGAGEFISFRRFDRMGSVPTPESLVGTWSHGSIGTVEFRADGTATVSVDLMDGGRCEASTGWQLDGDTLVIDADFRDGIDCGAGGLAGGGIPFMLSESPRVRMSTGGARRLWLAGDGAVTYLDEMDAEEPAS